MASTNWLWHFGFREYGEGALGKLSGLLVLEPPSRPLACPASLPLSLSLSLCLPVSLSLCLSLSLSLSHSLCLSLIIENYEIMLRRVFGGLIPSW